MFIDQQITEISAYIQATNIFINDFKLPESCKAEMYKKMSTNMMVFDDDTDNFYDIAISENGNIFIGNVKTVNVELLWDSMSLFMTGVDTDHEGLIPLSVVTSIRNRYVWTTSALETVFSHEYIDNQSNTQILFPTTISNIEASEQDTHSFNNIISEMYDVCITLSSLYTNVSERFSDIYKYYQPWVSISFYRSMDMTGRVVNIGTLYDYVSFTMFSGGMCNCIKVDLKDAGVMDSSIDISKLKISVEKCNYVRISRRFCNDHGIIELPWELIAPLNHPIDEDCDEDEEDDIYDNDDDYDI